MPQGKSTNNAINNAIKVIDGSLDYKTYINRIPGLSVAIVHNGKVVFSKGYGYANLEKSIKATDKTCYRIASISKTFTATAIMQLVEQGKLQLDDTVAKHVTWFPLKNITLRQLLTHSAGVDRDGNTGHWEDDHFPDFKEFKQHILDGIAIYPPLETFKYSNFGYAIIGQVISAVSGKSYEDYITKNIIQKLKLKHTSVEVTTQTENLLATGYGRDMPNREREIFTTVDTKTIAAAAGLVSNAIDLCMYMSAQLPGNTSLLSDESKREMQRIQWVRKNTTNHYGLGYEIWENKGKQLYGHGGGFHGYSTCIQMDAQNKLGVALLTNATSVALSAIMEGVYDTLHYFLEKDHEFISKVHKPLNKYVGRFGARWGETDMVEVNGQLLAYSPRDNKPMEYFSKLELIGKDTFKIVSGHDGDSIGETVRYEFDKSGKVKKMYFGANPLLPSLNFPK